MIRFEFDVADLTRLRFAISPVWELMFSVRAFCNPATAALHVPWIRDVTGRLEEIDTGPMFALVPPEGYVPDFLSPPPTTPLASFEDELAIVRATPPERVVKDVTKMLNGDTPSPAVEPYLSRPDEAVGRLADTMAAYWAAALEPHWLRVRNLLEADLLYRARQLTEGGPAGLFTELDPAVGWREGGLEVQSAWDQVVHLEGRGLLLLPTAFHHRPAAITPPPWQPTLIYRARGVGLLWAMGEERPSDALAGVLGKGRASVLMALEAPRSTQEVARRLGVTPGGVSQHLSTLRAAGLVNANRHGRTVLYVRTELADELVRTA